MQDDNSLLARIGARLRTLRTEQELTQEELAALSNVDRTFIGSVERGERNVSVLTLCQIIVPLGVDFKTFVASI